MALEAILTVGWPDVSPDDPYSAAYIHETCHEACRDEKEYANKLQEVLRGLRAGQQEWAITIKACDGLFRRQTSGFGAVKQLIAGLNNIVAVNPSGWEIYCEMDAFAYAFLKGAKNFDLFLPESTQKTGLFREAEKILGKKIKALVFFEREGKLCRNVSRKEYLAMRRVVSRKSARDERRVLASLLVSGPSTTDELCSELGLSNNLAERIIATFLNIGALEQRGGKYLIVKNALARVVFCLRETLGLDLLPLLNGGN